jgi:uncharacterized protein with FMN-binding domain
MNSAERDDQQIRRASNRTAPAAVYAIALRLRAVPPDSVRPEQNNRSEESPVRRIFAVLVATALAVFALLVTKSGVKPAVANAATVVRSGDKVTATGPKVVLAHGIVQVQVTLINGKITDVTALSMPHDNPHSWGGAQTAGPKLRSEVLEKQSANIDIVSGATYTSKGYAQSLQAALDAAHA